MSRKGDAQKDIKMAHVTLSDGGEVCVPIFDPRPVIVYGVLARVVDGKIVHYDTGRIPKAEAEESVEKHIKKVMEEYDVPLEGIHRVIGELTVQYEPTYLFSDGVGPIKHQDYRIGVQLKQEWRHKLRDDMELV